MKTVGEQYFIDRWDESGEKDVVRMAARLSSAKEKLAAKGGTLVLVRLPTSGAVRSAEAIVRDRSSFWDPLVGMTGIVAVHFEDHEELAFTCPDGQHLDESDAERFTARLVEVLLRSNP